MILKKRSLLEFLTHFITNHLYPLFLICISSKAAKISKCFNRNVQFKGLSFQIIREFTYVNNCFLNGLNSELINHKLHLVL